MPADWLQEALDDGLSVATTLAFPSMIYSTSDAMQLVAVKAVSAAYPLRGELSFSDEPFGEARAVVSGPGVGEVWLDSRLFPLLDISLGSSVALGDASFTVAGAVRAEPDQVSRNLWLWPKVVDELRRYCGDRGRATGQQGGISSAVCGRPWRAGEAPRAT